MRFYSEVIQEGSLFTQINIMMSHGLWLIEKHYDTEVIWNELVNMIWAWCIKAFKAVECGLVCRYGGANISAALDLDHLRSCNDRALEIVQLRSCNFFISRIVLFAQSKFSDKLLLIDLIFSRFCLVLSNSVDFASNFFLSIAISFCA